MTSRMYSRRDFLGTLGCASAAFALAGCKTQATPSKTTRHPPNIVFILADDLGYGDPRCYNTQSKVPTPELDRLAGEGIRFTDAHTPSAVCTPTRYGFLTGRYCWRSRLKSGVLWGYSEPLIEADRLTVASLLRRHRYNTGCIGKWHLGLGWVPKDPAKRSGEGNVDYDQPVTHGPQALGFDYSYIIPASLDMDPYCWLENGRVIEAPTEYTPDSKRRWDGGEGYWRGGPIAPSFDFYGVLPTITAKSVEFIERQEAATPFFLYVPLNAPHTPWMPTKEFRGKSEADWYGDFVAQTDACIGQIVQALDKLGFGDNTLVIVTSDNGSHWPVEQIQQFDHRANGPWRGQKADIHEGGHRVPFLCRWPGRIKPGTQSSQTICLTDLMATCAAVVGESLAPDAGQDSYNILPAMLDPGLSEPIRKAVVHHSPSGMFSIRQGPWKLILGLGTGGFTRPATVEPKPDGPKGQLYNLQDDPAEQKNLWMEQPEIVKRLTALLERYQQQGHSRPM
ncbi:MAG TPA: twin-arginine translocation signal domain-containing protein [Phycisphaerales bacterium]|nr:twin-arginine translocation signal domain-containing protein [Phycisphaerales bacterium]